MRTQLLFLILFFQVVFSRIAWSQQFELVKDINTDVADYGPSIESNVKLNNYLIYIGSNQVWSLDGTNGPVQLTNLAYFENAPITDLTAGSKYAFFKAFYDGNYWLFRTNGTVAGTIRLHQIWTSYYSDIKDVNGTVYFSGAQAYNKLELWKTDGTAGGTSLVKAFDFPAGTSSPRIVNSYNFNGKLVFLVQATYNNVFASRLWISDGTAAGTVAGNITDPYFSPVTLGNFMYYTENNILKRTDGKTVTTIRQGFISIRNLLTVGSRIFFTADDGNAGYEVWKTDGTAAGTVLVKDIYQGPPGFGPEQLVPYKGILYFTAFSDAAGRELWKTDGTAASTVQVSNISGDPASYQIAEVEVVNNQLAFTVQSDDIRKLWKSDGTASGTAQVTDLAISASYPSAFANNFVYVKIAINGGVPLYKSDLTAAGTTRISQPFQLSSIPRQFINVNGTIYFITNYKTDGLELWKTDGTTAGTTLVKDKLPSDGYGNAEMATAVNRTLYFVTGRNVLWKSDGTSEGTIRIKDVSENDSKINHITVMGGTVFFVVDGYIKHAIWKTDGTAAGTTEIIAFNDEESYNIQPVVFKGALYFVAYDGTGRHELWKSDGTTAGTIMVTNGILSGGEYAESLVVYGDSLYLLTNEMDDYTLWKSDGTAAGTTQVINIPNKSFNTIYSSGFYIEAGLLWFSLRDGHGKENLWRSDGTNAGTFPVASSDEAYYDDDHISILGSVANKLFFVPYDETEVHELANADQLWVTDGTVAGTRQLTYIDSPPTEYDDRYHIQYSAIVDNILYFVQNDPATGTELWRSDGTEEGTYVAVDNHPEPRTGTPFSGIANLNGTLIIGADGELYKYKPVLNPTQAIRINSGGGEFNASGNRVFSADQYFSGTTQLSNAASGDILNTTDDQLYKEQRFGSSFSYAVPVKNGKAEVVLYFAEIYWGVPARSGMPGADKRKFNVDMEGERKLTNYDIFAAAGGAMRARTESFTVNVTDGILNIDFLSGSADKPIIAAIEVIPDGQLVLEPVADAYVRNMPNQDINFGKETILEVKSGSLPAYQRETYLRFALNGVSQISSAKLRIYGSNVQSTASTSVSVFGVEEDNWLETGIAWFNAPESTGGPLSSVNVNNTAQYYELDVTAHVRSQLSGNGAVSLLLTNPSNQNTRLSFNSRENTVNRPQLVIETEASPAARTAPDQDIVQTETKPEASNIYPNPAGKHFAVYVSKVHKGKIDFQLISLAGNKYQLKPLQTAAPASRVEVDISSEHLPTGIYTMRIQSATSTEMVKVLLTEN